MTHRYERSPLRVAAAAIRVGDVIYSVPPPGRHHHVIGHMREEVGITTPQDASWEQGFVLSDGTFADRKQAARVALESGQIPKLNWPPNLFSEDLW